MSIYKTKKRIGILGCGEVGLSLKALYDCKKFDVFVKDKNDSVVLECLDVLNVCIPYTNEFENIVSNYIKQTNAELTIIHTTLPVGTTTNIDNSLNFEYNIVHSPVRGNHPDLTKSLTTFIKYIASPSPKAIKLAASHLRELDVNVSSCNAYEKTELAKLLCTTYYGLCIAWHNEIKKACDKFNVDVEFIQKWNASYNNGYAALGLTKFTRPVLTPPENDKIGGHCVVPNAELLDTLIDSDLIKEIIKYK
jgi:UDP-N-acetyl-D-mannosaminuronate dehydrogenase